MTRPARHPEPTGPPPIPVGVSRPEALDARCASNADHEVPDGLDTAGTALWSALVADYSFDPHELAVLGVACRQADDVAALEAVIRSDGYTVAGSAGQPRLNGAVSEVRQGRLALGKLLGALALPDDDGKPLTRAQRQAQHAARVRWDRERARVDGAA